MNIADFKKQIEPHKAIMGIDYGTKRMGIAVSDILLNIACSYKIIYRSSWRNDVNEMKKIIADKEIGAIIYGLPLNMNGQEGDIALEVKAFAEKLYTEINIPFAFWDERLSSLAMEKFLIKQIDLSRQKRKKVLDASAAAYILQGALDAMKYQAR